MTTLYGIPNCDTVKKARAWLTSQGKAHVFHDFKKQGVPSDQLTLWVQEVGWEALLNRKGTTWRKLAADEQAATGTSAGAQALMQAQPSVIKRPVVDWGVGVITVGFNAVDWQRRL